MNLSLRQPRSQNPAGDPAPVTAPPRAAAEEAAQLAGTSLEGARISIYAAFEACEEVWRRAVEDCACYVFQSFEWQSIWYATLGSARNARACIVHVADRDSRTLMLLPLGIFQRSGIHILQFLGSDPTDYNAPVIDARFAREVTPADFQKLWDAILKRLPGFDLVWLRRMPETIEGIRNPLISLPGTAHANDAYGATLPDNFEAFKATRSSAFFKQSRRKWRRLKDRGRVDLGVATDTAEAVELLKILARQKARRWKETGVGDAFTLVPGFFAFYEGITKASFQTGSVHVTALRVDDQVVATDWGLVFKGRFYSLMAGYESGEWARYSVGRLLLESVVTWCIEEPGIDIFDLTVGGESYKGDWADHSLRLYDYLASRTLRGAVFSGAHQMREKLRKSPHIRTIRRILKGRRGAAHADSSED